MGEGLDSAAVTKLYEKYGFFVRRRCTLLLRDNALADDALQETFLKLMKSGRPILEAEHPMRWLYRVADRACLDLLRRTKRSRQATPIDDVAGELLHPGDEPDVRRRAIELLDVLDEEQQRVCVMAFVDGMTQQEIADELGVSRVTIVKRVAGIRERVTKREAS